jgi:hypothetical protein
LTEKNNPKSSQIPKHIQNNQIQKSKTEQKIKAKTAKKLQKTKKQKQKCGAHQNATKTKRLIKKSSVFFCF